MWRLLFLAALALGMAAPLHAQAGGSSNVRAPANVKVVKPLQLTALRNLDFGTIIMGTMTATETVTVAPSGRTCGSAGQLTCTGAFTTAQYRVSGTNNQVVLIRPATPTFTLTNARGAQLTLTPSMPASVTIRNSGNQGVLFEVGGSLSIPAGTADGVYTGTIDIQVNYQ